MGKCRLAACTGEVALLTAVACVLCHRRLLSRRPQIMTSVDRVHVTKLGKMARASVGAKAWSAMCAAEFDKVIARFPLSKPTEAEVGSRGTHLISSAFGGMRAGPGTGGIRAGGATTRSPASAPAAPAPAAVFTGTYHTASPPSMPPTQRSPGRRVITIGVSSGPSTRSAGGGHASPGSASSGPLTPRAAAASARARASRKQQSTALSAAARAPAQPVSLRTSLSPPKGGGLKLTLPSDEPSPERRAMVSPSHAVPSSASSGVERQPGFSPGSRTSAAVAAPAPALALAPHVSGSPTSSASRNATAQRLLATESRHSMRSERSLASHDSSNSLASALRTRGHLRRASIDSSTPLSRHRRRLSVDADGASPGAWSNDSPRNEATPPPQLDSPRRDSHYVEAKVIVGAGSTGLPIYDAAEAERNSIAVAISPSGQQIPKRQKKVVANFSTRMAAAEARERQRRLSGTHSRSRVSLLSASSNDPQSPR